MNYLLCNLDPAPIANNGGCVITGPGWIHSRRKLESSVLILGRKGHSVIEENGVRLEIKPDRLILLIAGRTHEGIEKTESPLSYYWFHFTSAQPQIILDDNEISAIFSSKDIIKQRLGKAALIPQQFDITTNEIIVSIFRDLLNEQENPSYTTCKFQNIFENLLIAITETLINLQMPVEKLTDKLNIVHSVISIAASEIHDPNLSVKSISQKLFLHPDYIGRQFKKVMHISVWDYILKQRIKLAEMYLQETQEPVSVIAEKCGFLSTRHFLRQFKEEMKMTPTEIRRRFRAMHINII